MRRLQQNNTFRDSSDATMQSRASLHLALVLVEPMLEGGRRPRLLLATGHEPEEHRNRCRALPPLQRALQATGHPLYPKTPQTSTSNCRSLQRLGGKVWVYVSWEH